MFSFKSFNKSNKSNDICENIINNILEDFINYSEDEPTHSEEARVNWINSFCENSVIDFNSKKYKLLKQIGNGSYGVVWKVCDLEENYYALKIIKCNEIKGELIHQELSKNTNVITGYKIDILDTPENVPTTHGFLMDLGYPVVSINFMEIFYILINICSNLEELNEYNLCHNDIKPCNIIRKIDGVYSLIDFSLTSHISKITDNRFIQTRWYRPLEVLTNSYDIDYLKNDIWALGCTIFELITKSALFPGNSTQHQIDLVSKFFDLTTDEQYSYLYNEIFKNETTTKYKNKKILIDLLLILLAPHNDRPTATVLLPIIKNSLIKIEL